MKTECSYLYDWVKKKGHIRKKYHQRRRTPEAKTENAKEEEEYNNASVEKQAFRAFVNFCLNNGAMTVIVLTTNEALIEAIQCLLTLSSKETRQKVEQVIAYLRAVQIPKKPLHDTVQDDKG